MGRRTWRAASHAARRSRGAARGVARRPRATVRVCAARPSSPSPPSPLASGCGGGGPRHADGAAPRRAATPATAAAIAAQPALSPPLARRPAGRTIRVGPLPDAIAADPFTHTFAVAHPRPEPPRARRLAQRAREGARRRPGRPGAAAGARGLPRPGRDRPPRGRRPARHAHGGRRARRGPPRSSSAARSSPAADAVDVLDRGRPTAKLGTATTRPAGIAAADFDTQARGRLDRPAHAGALRPAHAAPARRARPPAGAPRTSRRSATCCSSPTRAGTPC